MLNWEKLGNIFDPTSVGKKSWMQEYAQLPFPYVLNEDIVRVYFATRPKKDSDLQYVSRSGYVDLDRKNLTRIINISDKPIFEMGSPGSFDEFGAMTSCFVDVGKDIYAYYTGWSRLSTVPYTMAIGLAISSDGGNNFKKLAKVQY